MPRKQTRITISLDITDTLALDTLCKAAHRSRSSMIRYLISTSVEATGWDHTPVMVDGELRCFPTYKPTINL